MEEQKEGKKQIPLRLSAKLYRELAAWAEDEFRSVNGQIEYLLTECVKKRHKGDDAKYAPLIPCRAKRSLHEKTSLTERGFCCPM